MRKQGAFTFPPPCANSSRYGDPFDTLRLRIGKFILYIARRVLIQKGQAKN